MASRIREPCRGKRVGRQRPKGEEVLGLVANIITYPALCIGHTFRGCTEKGMPARQACACIGHEDIRNKEQRLKGA
eukprot:127984-Pelagomonas_calceolata.AAC.2